jgi:DNA-binding response OmpR family regulator
VATAPDGNRALNIGMDADIRLVILEAQLPIYDGVEVLALLRRRYLARPVKVIALTSDDSEDVCGPFVRHGIDGLLTKPVDMTRLQREVAKLMPDQGQLDVGLYRRVRVRQMRLRAG